MADRHGAGVAVVNARVNVERQSLSGGEMEEGRAMAVFRFGRRSRRTATGLLEHLRVIVLPCGTLGMPRGQVGDGHPGAHGGPEVGRSCGHDERHMAAAGTADEVDPGSIDARVAAGIGDRVEDVLRGQVRGAGFRPAIRAAEIRSNEYPAHFLRLSDPGRTLFKTAAPGVKEHNQWDGRTGDVMRYGFGAPINHLLERAVLGARDVDGEFEGGGLGLCGGRTFDSDLGVGGEGHGGQEQPREEAEDHRRIIGRASERRLRLPCMGQG